MHAVLENIVQRFSRELNGLDLDTVQRHPLEKSYLWGIQEIVEHLVLSYRLSTRELEGCLAKGRVAGRQRRTPVQWVLQLMVLSFGHFPRGAPALEETMPGVGFMPAADGEDLAALLRKELELLDEVLGRCRRQYGMERVAADPILGPMRVDQWRRFHFIHTAHHLEQLLRVKNELAPEVNRSNVFSVALAEKLRIPAQRSVT
ncbi:MAG TPA: DUF1569 domain-containing protein [Acidobacteriaceae bacterium]|jgi:hypothetical protein